MTRIWTDGSFDWLANLNSKRKTGRIAYKLNERKVRIKEISIPEIPGLKQYSNIFELLAVLEAIKKTRAKRVQLFIDSQVVFFWIKSGKDLYFLSELHGSIQSEIQKRVKKLKEFSINWIRREENPAGKALEIPESKFRFKSKSFSQKES